MYMPVSTSPVLGLQAVPDLQAFRHGLWGMELCFLCLQGKNFTDIHLAGLTLFFMAQAVYILHVFLTHPFVVIDLDQFIFCRPLRNAVSPFENRMLECVV